MFNVSAALLAIYGTTPAILHCWAIWNNMVVGIYKLQEFEMCTNKQL
jgi:hypothetical protein